MSSNVPADRLTPEQKEVWDEHRFHVPKPSRGQTRQQAINLSALSFLFLCDFTGLEPVPTEAAIRAEFVAAGVPELCPGPEFWEHLRRHPGHHWILAPGASLRQWDFERFGRPTIYRMETAASGASSRTARSGCAGAPVNGGSVATGPGRSSELR